jgi:hypothetical protein
MSQVIRSRFHVLRFTVSGFRFSLSEFPISISHFLFSICYLPISEDETGFSAFKQYLPCFSQTVAGEIA